MPSMKEWEKSQRLTTNLRADIASASIRFCFEPLSEIFEELYIVLAWDLYHIQTPTNLLTLYTENKEIMDSLVGESATLDIKGIGTLPSFNSNSYGYYNNRKPEFPIDLPLLNQPSKRCNAHRLHAPEVGTNKKERALHKRYIQLQKDIKVFSQKVSTFHEELIIALANSITTKQFSEQNPEFGGYMKQSLKKFYSDKHPNVINSLRSALDVRAYASLTANHRLQAYQVSMLAQLQQLEPRHTPLDSTVQT